MQPWRIPLFIILLSGVPALCSGQQFSQRVASYKMDVALNAQTKRVDATTELTWINPSADTVRELQFHMYLNAFKNTRSTWMREDEFYMTISGQKWYAECNWGWVHILDMEDASGNDLKPGFAYISPENIHPEDETVLRVSLREPVMPFDTATFVFTWASKIPRAVVRTGYNYDFFFMAQWFPKLGVYEPAGMRYAEQGGWNCHPYHANSEYYADFGSYEVSISVPNKYTVGASGTLLGKEEDRDQTTWHFKADDVIDFAWSASPHFMEMHRPWNDVNIELLIYPEHQPAAPRFFESMEYALAFLDEKIGDYPYPQITIVASPAHGLFAGAMEYPTLITAFTTAFLPEKFRGTETLVVHEFIHQYFMQMVATNEQEEPWMDEGITSYYEATIMDKYYGPKTSMIDWGGVRIGNFEYARHEYLASPYRSHYPNTLPSWEYEAEAYSALSYSKAAIWLKTLEGLIGAEVMDTVMRTYFERWKFRHPCAEDFIEVVNEVVSERVPEKFPDGMDWYFDQVLRGTEMCDYAVLSISHQHVEPALGFIEDTTHCVLLPEDFMPTEKMHHARTNITRLGDMKLPVEIRITFDDGTVADEFWDGLTPFRQFEYTGSRRIVSVEVDPDRKILMDLNFLNNSRTVEVQQKALNTWFIKWLSGMQRFMETISFIV